MIARRLALALPVAALILQWDRLSSIPAPFPDTPNPDISSVYPALPARDEGRLGRTGDVLNILFLGTEGDLRSALETAGWTSLPLTIAGSTEAGLEDLLYGRPLTRFPPMNEYRIMGRAQDMNWVRVIKPVQTRHHFRLWRTGIADARGRSLWWGSGNYDLSVRWRDLSHRPDPDMNLERDFLSKTLEGVPGVASRELISLPQLPRSGANDKGYPFRTDGRALLVELASPPGR